MTSERFRLEPALGLYCNYITFAAPGACFDVYSVRKAPQAHDILNALCDLKARPGGPEKAIGVQSETGAAEGSYPQDQATDYSQGNISKKEHNDARDG